MRKSGIYRILCLKNGRSYIGSTCDFKARWYHHKWHLRRGSHWNIHLQRAWDKYGARKFRFEELENCEARQLILREQHYLDHWERPLLFNLSTVAKCPESTEAVREARSVRAKAQHAAGTLGRVCWKTDRRVAARKAAKTRRKNGTQVIPSFEWTPERRGRVAAAMRLRRAAEKAAGFPSPRTAGYGNR